MCFAVEVRQHARRAVLARSLQRAEMIALVTSPALGVASSPVLAPLPAPALLPPLLGVAPSAAGGLLGGSGRSKLVWQILREGRDPFEERNYRGLHLGRRGIRNLFLSGEVAAERCWRAARRRWERRR